MSVKIEKINHELVGELRRRSAVSFNNGDYLGAFLLRFLFLEGTLVFIVATRLVTRPNIDGETFRKFKKAPRSFPVLVNYFYLLTDDLETRKKLLLINTKRNRLVHEAFHYDSYEKFTREMKILAEEINSIENHLLDTYVDSYLKEQKNTGSN